MYVVDLALKSIRFNSKNLYNNNLTKQKWCNSLIGFDTDAVVDEKFVESHAAEAPEA